MNPNIRNMGEHFGGTAYQDATNIHPLSIAAILILGIVMLSIPRRWSVLPILGITCFIPLTQKVTILSMDFNILRIMVLDRALAAHLLARRVFVAVRYTGGVGGIRVSTHYFNNEEDVERLAFEVRAALGR